MSDTKWTPGPWRYQSARGSKQERCYWDIYGKAEEFEYRGSVCEVFDAAKIDGISEIEALANARLISAAPELYEALQLLCYKTGFDPSIDGAVWQKAKSALAKARGE